LLRAFLAVVWERHWGARLTAAGRPVVPHAENAIAQNRCLVRLARSAAAWLYETRTLKISVPLASPLGALLAETARHFRSTHAEYRCLVGLDDRDIAAVLRDVRADVSLTWGVNQGTDPVQVLLEESASTLLGWHHPWAGVTEMPVTALTDEEVLFPVRGRGHCWDLLHKAAAAGQVRLMPVPTAPLAVSDLVAADLRVSVALESSRSRARGMWLACRCPVSLTGWDFGASCQAAEAAGLSTSPGIW
jgi:hypothetical protein